MVAPLTVKLAALLLTSALKAIVLPVSAAETARLIRSTMAAPSAAVAHGVDALNNSLGFTDPASMFRYFSTTSFSPNGINWGHYADPRVDDLLMQAQQSFDSEQQIELLTQAHAIVVDEAAWAFIVHDLNPRAMSPKVKGFQPAQSWYQDFTKVTVE